jgi:hypothetical protein
MMRGSLMWRVSPCRLPKFSLKNLLGEPRTLPVRVQEVDWPIGAGRPPHPYSPSLLVNQLVTRNTPLGNEKGVAGIEAVVLVHELHSRIAVLHDEVGPCRTKISSPLPCIRLLDLALRVHGNHLSLTPSC